ncbi:ABC transporter permease [Noviherbaspirillum autotrophicum]|uniref:ABC transporter ATP-binding protein n=1 Tax=Noviherbaspirillum autotrophicum TaxID=709839 RepID=A0A0C1YKE8_9BURK|nr:ABC transporter permease [Noviherbaspirillum autotrophicum]KIF80937.1 ABC transporter ATP-binding protein [Noviherbaspirillum autotrophicum]
MEVLKLILKNALRHKLRTSLTVLGLVVATLAFGLLQTVVGAWYAGADAASNTRLVTRNAISLVFPLPLSYENSIRGIEGVTGVAYANWFGGIYQEPKNFFPQLAISGRSYLDLYPEFVLDEDQRAAFLRDRKGCVVGSKLAAQYGFKLGDVIPIKGTIFPGQWEFVVRGIYDGRQETTDTSQFFFHWDYLNETLLKTSKRRGNQVGLYVVRIDNPDNAAAISGAIDRQFKNSLAETLTETEKAFQLGFVSMSEAIVVAIRVVSFVVIVIIMAVMANTMAMSARERLAEYATLKALGFGPGFLALLIFGESLLIALVGAAIGIVLLFPVAHAFSAKMGTLFPVFEIAPQTLLLQALAALTVGIVAAIAPTLRSMRVNIVDGLRSIG